MKKIIGVAIVLCLILGFSGCPSTGGSGGGGGSAPKAERKIGGNVPQFVKDAVKNTPEDALVGIGTARAQSLSLARTTAATRARAEISRQMNTMIQDMVRDYSAGSEVDPKAALSFQENITVALSKSTLTGSTIVQEDTDEAGNYWVVVQLSKASTVSEINQAQAAARLAVPAMASFNAEDRMNKAFDKAYSSELGVGDK
ncbi:hypothetical protein [Treponema sp. R80B11-R83G3]